MAQNLVEVPDTTVRKNTCPLKTAAAKHEKRGKLGLVLGHLHTWNAHLFAIPIIILSVPRRVPFLRWENRTEANIQKKACLGNKTIFLVAKLGLTEIKGPHKSCFSVIRNLFPGMPIYDFFFDKHKLSLTFNYSITCAGWESFGFNLKGKLWI